jgi:hypothetical protein
MAIIATMRISPPPAAPADPLWYRSNTELLLGADCLMHEPQPPNSAQQVPNSSAGQPDAKADPSPGRPNTSPTEAASLSSPGISEAAPPQRIPHWLQQAERMMRVIVRMYIGLLVCIAPWFPQAWDANPLFVHSPSVAQFITQGYVRGIVSGVGLLNLWIALRDAIRGSREPGQS